VQPQTTDVRLRTPRAARPFRLHTGYSIGLGYENFAESYLFSLHANNHAPLDEVMVLHLVLHSSVAGIAGAAVSCG
jgi:hypothetical protein